MIDWHAILAEHGDAVWRTCYRLLNQHADAWDCYQEVFLAAWQSRGRQPVQDWAAYLATLAARRAIDRLRQRARARELVSALDHDPPAGHGPVEQAIRNELLGRVRAGLSRLPDRQAEVFWLSCVEGLSHQQIAAQLKTSPGAVRVLLQRARVALAAYLESSPMRKST
jgi:RNA polymerase sigma-70 factor, ECF subfamily